ncbi:hypothetical protein F2Q70_00036749 [Brassica cretica]|uniref:Uncharacterized protein n=1 Tax=Brassica cretica TaxID=69181 RepID=A0A8S9JQA7_BRACR|nr:hypothetical protein F2Q70_00036749 [Brassica cretica]
MATSHLLVKFWVARIVKKGSERGVDMLLWREDTPAGKVLINYYCKSPKASSLEFTKYIKREDMISMMFKHMCSEVFLRRYEVPAEATVRGEQRNPRPSRLSHSPMLKRYSIQMKLTQFNFSLKHSSFTVSRIYDHHQRPPIPNFDNREGNDYPSDDMLGIGDVETSPSPVVNRNVSVNTKDCTADGMVVGETTETNAPSDPC